MAEKSHHNENIPQRNLLKKIKDFFLAIKPIITAHHPLCEYYEEHTLDIVGRKYCIGCFIGYPSAILMLIIGYSVGFFIYLSTATLFIIGGILYSSLLLSIFGLTKKKPIKILSKISFGLGTSFMIAGFFSFPLKFWLNFLQAFLFVQAIIGLMTIKRKKEMDRTCKNCQWDRDWDNCPGMKIVNQNLRDIGFIKRNIPQNLK